MLQNQTFVMIQIKDTIIKPVQEVGLDNDYDDNEYDDDEH